MKKDAPFEWDQAYRNAFDSIKKYLLNPPVLGAPIPGKPLILYIAAQEESLSALLAQNNKECKEMPLYYLSRRLTPIELKYPPIEKTCLALVFATKKLRHYFLAHTVHHIARADPLKYVMSRPVLSGRLARWSILLNEFEIIYVPRKAVKGQVLVDFLADYPIPADWEISGDFPDEEVFLIDILLPWMIFFDGSARSDGAGVSVVFVFPQRQILSYAFTLTEKCSNNVAEYQALIIGLQMVSEMKIMDLEIYRDSQLVINQLLKEYEVKKDNLIPYHCYAFHLLKNFDSTVLEHIPRK
ncbi:uncharacterized protein LOC132277787 [Cornus florida]|uniref:uncharacterized protein LOC132277787 n=1 Tax=Cornus florida TaxID=4283 RepID=UPI0028991820|nr:uncharacterized protein LOC132277787 [Cornus florida]